MQCWCWFNSNHCTLEVVKMLPSTYADVRSIDDVIAFSSHCSIATVLALQQPKQRSAALLLPLLPLS